MKIYLAGKFTSKERLKGIRDTLQSYPNIEVISTWLDEEWTDYDAPENVLIDNALRDMVEVEKADMLVIDTLDESNTGGREFELGYAFSRSIPAMLVGPKRHIFHHLLYAFPDWDTALAEFQEGTAAMVN